MPVDRGTCGETRSMDTQSEDMEATPAYWKMNHMNMFKQKSCYMKLGEIFLFHSLCWIVLMLGNWTGLPKIVYVQPAQENYRLLILENTLIVLGTLLYKTMVYLFLYVFHPIFKQEICLC